MSEQRPLTDPEWTNSRSPDLKKKRITDATKAELVAQAIKPHEDESAALRNLTKFAMKRPYYESVEGRINFTDMHSELDHGEPSEQATSLIRDQNEALEVVSQLPGAHAESILKETVPISSIIDQIEHNNKASDNIAETVGDAFDKLEATKR